MTSMAAAHGWRGRKALPAALLAAALCTGASGCGSGRSAAGTPPPPPPPGCQRVSGHICPVAGTGVPGDGDDGLPPLETRLYLPQDVAVGPDGRVFVVDWNNHRVRAIDSDGKMRIVAGSGDVSVVLDDPSNTHLNHPTDVTFDPRAPTTMVVAAWHNNRVESMDLMQPPDSQVVDLCGTGTRGFGGDGGPAPQAVLNYPVGVAFDAAGNLLISDEANEMIRVVNRDTGVIEPFAGAGPCDEVTNGAPCDPGDEGPASAATFRFMIGALANPGGHIATDAAGNLYVADTKNYRLRKIDGAGVIHTVAGTGVAGSGGDGGPAIQAQLGSISDVAVGDDGSLYLPDPDNHCVRRVAPDGTIATFAGQCGTRGSGGDDGPATQATLFGPGGVAVAPNGDVYIADTHNQRVRVVYR